MKRGKSFFCLVLGIILVVTFISFSYFVFAIDDLMALQGNVDEGLLALSSGNLTVYIYDAPSGGNLIYDSRGDVNFNNSVSDGKFDVLLGNSSTNELHLKYGKLYYMEIYVNNEQFSFDGASRQPFQSTAGNISISDLDFSAKIVLSNQSTTLDAGQNITTGNKGWFKGLFNWVVDSVSTLYNSSIYLNFNGTTLFFNETQLNKTIASHVGGGLTKIAAENVTVADSGNLFNATNAEDVFTEIGSQLGSPTAPGINISTVWKQPVLDKDLISPPGAPGDGDRYIVAGSANWFNGGWAYRRKITSNNTKVAADETNAVVIVNISGSDSLFGNAQSDGDDIVFTDTDGQTKLDHYIEQYDDVGKVFVAFVEIPSFDADADYDIYMYYNNTGASNMQAQESTFSSSYGLFYDMDISGQDLTSNERDITSVVGDPAADNNAYGKAIAFDGNDAWSMKNIPYWEQEWDIRTHNIIFKTGADVSTRQVLFAEGGSVNGVMLYILSDNLYARWWSESKGWSGAHYSTGVSANTVYYVTMSYAYPGNYELYVNGVQIGSTATSVVMNAHSGDGGIAYTGGNSKDFHDTTASGQYFTGTIREFFATNDAWNENKHDTWYNNRVSSTFWTIDVQGTQSGDAGGDWAGHDNDITIYNSTTSSWSFDVPNVGWTVYVMDEGISYDWNGYYWSTYTTGVSHNTLFGLQGGLEQGSTSEYYHLTEAEHSAATRIANDTQTGLMPSSRLGDWDENSLFRQNVQGMLNQSIPFIEVAFGQALVEHAGNFIYDFMRGTLFVPNITINGSLGIGTIGAPSYELEVVGSGNFTGDVFVRSNVNITPYIYNQTDTKYFYNQSLGTGAITDVTGDINFNSGWTAGGLGNFNNTFDIGADDDKWWRAGYFGTDVYIGSANKPVRKWLYNMTASAISFVNSAISNNMTIDFLQELLNSTNIYSTYNETYSNQLVE